MNKKKAPDQKAQSHNTQTKHSIPPRMMRLALALLEYPAGISREGGQGRPHCGAARYVLLKLAEVAE